MNGLLVVDKPIGITSRTAVDRAQKWFHRGTRIGHAGTLDPLATGVLVLCIGSATRLMEYVQRMPKTYRAGILLGATSDTDDADGVITPNANPCPPDRSTIEQALRAFIGKIQQVPPAYSAAHVGGRRAYALARKGHEFELQPRLVTVHQIDIERYEFPQLDIVVHCGKGTYIRSIARDLGLALGCGGLIASLRRTAIGKFTEAEALAIDTPADTAIQRMLPAWHAVQDTPPIVLSADDTRKLRMGQTIANPYGCTEESAVVDDAGEFVALVTPIEGRLQPAKVFGVG